MGLAVVQGFKHMQPTSEESSCGRSTKHLLIKDGGSSALHQVRMGRAAVQFVCHNSIHVRMRMPHRPPAPPHLSARAVASALGAQNVPGRGVG